MLLAHVKIPGSIHIIYFSTSWWGDVLGLRWRKLPRLLILCILSTRTDNVLHKLIHPGNAANASARAEWRSDIPWRHTFL